LGLASHCLLTLYLVGRARFELATNGLKDLKLLINSSLNNDLNLPGK